MKDSEVNKEKILLRTNSRLDFLFGLSKTDTKTNLKKFKACHLTFYVYFSVFKSKF